MSQHEVVIPGYFIGPAASANGGYAAGLAAAYLGEPSQVRLRKPPPIDRPLAVRGDAGQVEIVDGDVVVMVAQERESLDVKIPEVDLAIARAARAPDEYMRTHAAPTCFVCGGGRSDGLRIFPATIADGIVATGWRVPDTPAAEGGVLTPASVWAALDCPGGWSFGKAGDGFFPALIAQSADIYRPVRVGEDVIVLGWKTGKDGRKMHAATAILGLDGEPYAVSEQTCYEMPADWAQGGDA